MATHDSAIQQMLGAGMPEFPPGHPRMNTSRMVRYGPKGRAFYRLFEYQAKNGKFYISGTFGMWGAIEPTKIASDYEGMDVEERERLKRSQAELERRERAKRADRAQFAARRAESQWHDAHASGECPYLVRKGLMLAGSTELPEKGLRVVADGTLLVPMIRYDVTEAQADDPNYSGPRRLAGLQKIAPDGAKRFNRGMAKEGVACRIGKKVKNGDLLIVGEGLATVLSAHLALKKRQTFFVAFDSGNLLPVARILRQLYPKSPLLFLADDDAYLEAYLNTRLRGNYAVTELFRADFGEQTYQTKHGAVVVRADFETDPRGTPFLRCGVNIGGKLQTFLLKNPGRTAAWEASAAVGNAWVCWPEFAERVVDRDPDKPRLTDFNDLHAKEGIERVREQLAAEIKAVIVARELSEQIAHGAPAAGARETKARRSGGNGRSPPPRDDFDWDEFPQRFTYIYPTDTAWDARARKLVKISAMSIHFGAAVVKWWLASDRRRTVNDVDVVFDPTCKCDAQRSINLFDGLESKPSADGSCEKLLALLQYLCREEGQDTAPTTDWVLDWTAYTLQHLGAKMQTAIVMHGFTEGTGKTIFWSAVREIFGRYGAVITQTELESDYNAWLSQKLLLIANEVVSPQEKRHHVGKLKNLITEAVLPINEKFLPLRYERNHANLVFLTNELHALQISPNDRRCMVIKTPSNKPEDYYAGVIAELAAGGVAALHHYLLNRDCGDFNEHTKPLHTASREDLIDLGMGSPQLFQQELHEGLLHPLVYGPCFSGDLYRAYTIWCNRNGVKNPRASNTFRHEFMAMNGVTKKIDRVRDPDKLIEASLEGDAIPQRTVFRMGARSESIGEADWVQSSCAAFRQQLREYASDNILYAPGTQDLHPGRRERDGNERPF